MNESSEQVAAKAAAIWQAMDRNARQGVRFGLFPAEVMAEGEGEGYDGRLLAIALMDCAEKDGGMIG